MLRQYSTYNSFTATNHIQEPSDNGGYVKEAFDSCETLSMVMLSLAK